ncbi:MAG: hypothetical protein ACFFCO_12710, partial [Promethearchaeota archaeon]
DRAGVEDFAGVGSGHQRVAGDAKVALNHCPAVVVAVIEVVGPDGGCCTSLGCQCSTEEQDTKDYQNS